MSLPKMAIPLFKGLQSLPKGAWGSNVLKSGVAEMMHWSVCGLSLFLFFFAAGFFEHGKKEKNGGKLSYWIPYHLPS
jgi:hypothetical protein